MISNSYDSFCLANPPRELTPEMERFAKTKASGAGWAWLILVIPLSIPASIVYFQMRKSAFSFEPTVAMIALLLLIILWSLFFISLIRSQFRRKRLYPVYAKVLREGNIINARVEDVQTRGQKTRLTQMVDVKVNDELVRIWNKNIDLIRYETGMEAEILYHSDHPDIIVPMALLIDFINSYKVRKTPKKVVY